MKKQRNERVIKILLSAIVLMAFILTCIVSVNDLKRNVETQAYAGLASTQKNQSDAIRHALDLQYETLESVALYIGTIENFSVAENVDMLNSVALANNFCTLCFAGIDGNAANCLGKSAGNVLQRDFFKTASKYKGARAMEYLTDTTYSDEPQVIMAVPVRRNNALIGVLYAGQRIDVMQNSLFSCGVVCDGLCAITDSDGTVIAACDDNQDFENKNIFSYYNDDVILNGVSSASISAEMLAQKSGSFKAKNDETQYVSYTPLGVNNWYLISSVCNSVLSSEYSFLLNTHYTAICILAGCLFICIAVIFYNMLSHIENSKKDKKRADLKVGKIDTILTQISCAVYSYDLKTQSIVANDAMDKLLGFTLDELFVKNSSVTKAVHPEFDYGELISALSDVELTGNSRSIETPVDTVYGRKRLSITLNAERDENGETVGVFGIATDVTNGGNCADNFGVGREQVYAALIGLAQAVVKVNFTRNTYEIISYDSKAIAAKSPVKFGKYDDFVTVDSYSVPESDRKKYVDALSPDKVIEAFSSGKKKVELEHCQVGSDGRRRWVLTKVVPANGINSSDVYGIIIKRNLDENNAYESLLAKTYNLTIENMPCFVCKWAFRKGDVVLIDANRKYLDFMGVYEDDLLGQSILKYVDADERREAIQRLYESEKTRSPISFMLKSKKISGSTCWLKIQASYFDEENGESVYYGTLTDITELIEMQHELSENVEKLKASSAKLASVELYRSLLNQSKTGGMTVRSICDGSQMEVPYLSRGFSHTLGYTEEEMREMLKNEFKDLVHPDDYLHSYQICAVNTMLGDRFTNDFRMRHKDGHYLWLREYSQIVDMPDGKLFIVSMFVDISEQKELEEKLRISQDEYRVASLLCNCALFRYDIEHKQLTALSPVEHLLDFDKVRENVPEQLIESGTVAPEFANQLRMFFENINNGIQTEKTIMSFFVRDKLKLWVEIQYYIMNGESGKPIAAIISLSDKTQQKYAEEMMTLGRVVLDNTSDLHKMLIIDLATSTIDFESYSPHGNAIVTDGTKSVDDIFKATLHNIVIPEDLTKCLEFFSSARLLECYNAGSPEQSIDYRAQYEDGSMHWVNVHTRITLDSYTHNLKLNIMFTDINEQKLAELASTKASNAELPGIRTFGYFDVFVGGEPIYFTNAKEKELLAILVDRNGGTVTSEEAISILWPDEPLDERQLARYRKLAMRLKNTLEKYGIADIIVSNKGIRSIDVEKVNCDYYKYLDGDPMFRRLFGNAYMANYSWAEETLAALIKQIA